ncbi:hypothetical protein [Pseudoalteromonas luteoviolacea]|uniref:Lipoprotein n=1 Tax=Pseudoalteromonas luteoviolacea S4054 TaxID=1129367 RepID=A0A0F6AG62_9GAMM|nr:hypothetical protein [Pseudoalteromonas luteoviolacea]AOT09940.1 hypothetical protein S4054249_19870 [Pseudoalteromonas luteoviolacea]AOT14851.1 hypothetical protein S40542_19840 [Pseudoalteromonas luteoviolacea]AOT19767.1 hypothetical protein S4054_19845 [Pseudoalteromonas luteoviolacea]KKE85207.1 hypothetical protein N479_05600 [Pseudoalteromonas luteoviolacea S4054]KZN63977.1 hypothetical protein N481_02845 [Pseudoalteromonas luteoviolacea S4047-1]
MQFRTTLRNKIAVKVLILTSLSLLSACSFTPNKIGVPEKYYDFDHQIHYEQIKYNDDHYYLQIKADSYEHFSQQSIFLLRHSQSLCRGDQPQILLHGGVQKFDRLPLYPRPYQPDLRAEVKCIKEVNSASKTSTKQ